MNEKNCVVTLSTYEWHELLKELEYLLKNKNARDIVATKLLYERIATQLSNEPIKINFKNEEK